jgi:ABC-2 type transport system permease protein
VILAFFWRMLRDKYKSLAIFSLSSVVFLEMYVALYPSMRDQSDSMDQLLQTMPPEVFKAINIDPSAVSFSTLEAFLSMEFLSFLWPILAVIFAISLASYIVVNEIDKGTVETLASLPATRLKIFVERYLAGLVLAIGFTGFSMLSPMLLATIHGIDFVAVNYWTTFLGASVFIWAVFSLALLFSALMSDKARSTMLASGVLILMYVLNIISNLNDDFKNLQYVSFFHYFNGMDLMSKNTMDAALVPVLGVTAIVLSFAALWVFRRRDLL